MTEPGPSPIILWETLKLSAQPLRGRRDILVVALVRVQKPDRKGSDEYRINFEINSHLGLVSHDTEGLVSVDGEDGPRWRYSGRRDLLLAIKAHFLTTQLYAHVAAQLGWIPASGVEPTQAPLDP